MRMLPLFSNRISSVTTGAFLLFSAAFVAGCASKNPLIDEPVAQGRNPASQSAATTTVATPAPAPAQTAANVAAQPPSGVQVATQKRFLGIFSPYRIDIQQGNFVSREMVSQLKEGMTPEQVRFVLGTPLLTDIFHENRWDYPFRLVQGNGKITSSHVTVYFKDNRLTRIEGGDLPTETDFLFLIAGEASANTPARTARPSMPAPAQPTTTSPTDPIHRRRN